MSAVAQLHLHSFLLFGDTGQEIRDLNNVSHDNGNLVLLVTLPGLSPKGPDQLGYSVFIFLCLMAAPQHMEVAGARDQIRAPVVTYIAAATIAGSCNPLCQAGDRICVLTLQRHCLSRGTTEGTPSVF